MKRITTNDDIRFPIRVVKGLDSDIFTIQFYTTNKATNITKTNEDVEDGIIHLEWTELYPLGTGVMNYTVLIPEEDGSFSDDTFNKSISGTTIFYIVSNIIVPDGDDAQNLIDLVAELDTKLDAEISRSTGKDNAHDTALADVYTKSETNTLLAGKANKNGSANETFSTNALNLQREGAASTLYNYKDANDREFVSFYDQTGGSLTYKFTPNQEDNIATERQLALKANSADVYTKNETYNRSEIEGLIDEYVPDLPDNIVTDANYVHTDNNFTTTLKDKLDRIASGAEVNVQANWNETNSSSDAYIQNKPTNVSSFTNDAGYLTSYTETDPTVPSWAKAQNKPTYTASEVGALPDTTTIPSKVSDLTNDLGFVTGSKIYVGTCETAAATVPKVCTVETFPTDANGKPLLGTVISVKFTYTNTAASNLGLDVNGCGSASVWYNTGVSASKTYYGYAGRYITYMWDGTNWVWQGWSYDTNTTYTNVALGQGYAVQSNSSASATITATLSSYALTANGIVSVKFNYDVPANATLNINSKGAKAIYNKNAAITAGVIKAGDTATFMYNTYYRLISVDSWQDNTGGGGSITVDPNITGASQTNPVQGGAIYTALSGKAGFKEYSSKSVMEADSVPTGTIGFDSSEEIFYIYNSPNAEWKQIDQSKQRTYLKANGSGGYITFKDSSGSDLSLQQSKDLLCDLDKEAIIDYHGTLYYPISISDDGSYAEWTYISLTSTDVKVLYLDYTYEEGYEDEGINFSTSSKALPTTSSLGFGYMSTLSSSTSTAFLANALSGFNYYNGAIVVVKFTKDVGANATINISSKGFKPIYYQGAAITAGVINANDTAALVYNYINNRFELICTDHVPTKILSITTNKSNDASDVNYIISSGIIRVDNTRYKTYKIQDYSTTVPSGTTGIQFRFSKNTDYNTEPVTTLILRAENYSNIDWSTMNVSFYSQISGTSTEVTIKWKDNDSPVNTLAHLGNGVNYVVIKVYEGEYGTYEAW